MIRPRWRHIWAAWWLGSLAVVDRLSFRRLGDPTLNRQLASQDGQIEFLRFEAGQFGFNLERLRGFPHIQWRGAAGGLRQPGGYIAAIVKQILVNSIELFAKLQQRRERLGS